MKPIKFIEKIIIDQPASTVFDFTQDYSRRLEWDTSLKKAELAEGYTPSGKGAQVYYMTKWGIGMNAEYVSYNRPKVSAVKITGGSYLFRSLIGSWNYRDINEHQTELTFLYAFELRFLFSLYNYPIRRYLQYQARQSLHTLKTLLEKQADNKY